MLSFIIPWIEALVDFTASSYLKYPKETVIAGVVIITLLCTIVTCVV